MSDERFDGILDELADALDAREREALAASLALAADPELPDPAVRERVMERVAMAQATRRARALGRWREGLIAAAAAGLSALVVWTTLVPRGAPAPPETTVADARDERLDELEEMLEGQDEEIASLEGDLAAARDALSVLTAARLERLDLTGADASPASARVYWDWDAYSCYFLARDLPAGTEDRTYALWLYTDAGEVLLAGSFQPDARGGASFFAMLPKEMGHVLRAEVTAEAASPGEHPVGPVVLRGGGEEPAAG